ncbi:MAG: peptide-methionine (S)-S-oxide reductase MsrA [Actinobacteria bacterium]|nr:peptide-methionine (S)-S-oxide reductase MsrA [Actinomycetota bacterium]
MVDPQLALPGRAEAAFRIPAVNEVLGGPLLGPWGESSKTIYLAMGCFWGAEKKFWNTPGVIGTAVGYMGGITPNPTYDEVCTGATGHTETVMVGYDPTTASTYDVLKVFWENHDPTQGFRQGNDVGTQYRSAIYWTDPEQQAMALATAQAYNEVLTDLGFDPITTELGPAADHTFYPAETYHQQYLHKVPHGYDCHANTGIALPRVSTADVGGG